MKHNHRRGLPRSRRAVTVLERINPNVAGIDCGAAEHYVAVPPDRDPCPVQCFSTVTSDLVRLADWLTACRVTSVAMEATGVYWIPIFELLEARGFQVLLVNARHLKNVPGRKSDVTDCEWIRDLHSVGLLRASFRPPAAIATLRAYLRHRQTLIDTRSMHVLRMEKALVQINVQLPLVVSDLMGVTGQRILRDIVAGQRDPERLAAHRDHRCHASVADIVAALTGQYRPEHVFVLTQNLALYDAYDQQLAACDGGRLLSARPPTAANRAAAILRMAAMSLGRTDTALGAFYRRLAPRIGKPQAITATARKLAILVYRTLAGTLVYRDPGAEAYPQQQRSRVLRRLRHRAASLGFELVNRQTGEILDARSA